MILALSSKYSLALYEICKKRINLEHKWSEEFTLERFRQMLGVDPGKLEQFKHFNLRAIQPAYLLPRALPDLRRTYPDLRLYLREEQTARLLELLGRGRLDGAVIALPYVTAGLEDMLLGDDPLLVACPKEHRFAQLTAIDSGELVGERLLLLEDGHCLRNHALTACRLLPGQINEDLQATSLSTLVQMVVGGLGLTLVPRLAVEIEIRREPALAVVPFRDGAPARTIALVWRPHSVRASDLRLLGEALRVHLSGPAAPVTTG